MKLKATKKELRDNYYFIWGVGYCQLQNVERYLEPFSYCSGTYGWSCDNYELIVDNKRVLLSTGYNYIDSKNVNNVDYSKIEKLDKKVQEIGRTGDYQTAKKKVQELLFDFINKEVLLYAL